MKYKAIILNVIVSMVVSVCAILVYDKFFTQKIVTFDLQGYVATLRDLYLAKQIDDVELRKRIDKIEEIVLNTPKNKVIITSDVILGGDRVENLTPKLPERVKPKTENTDTQIKEDIKKP